MSSVYVTATIGYGFNIDDIMDTFGSHLTPVQIEEIAAVLAANVEVPRKVSPNGDVVICRENFNDSYSDMIEDLNDKYNDFEESEFGS